VKAKAAPQLGCAVAAQLLLPQACLLAPRIEQLTDCYDDLADY
jgi:hypothetical protein